MGRLGLGKNGNTYLLYGRKEKMEVKKAVFWIEDDGFYFFSNIDKIFF